MFSSGSFMFVVYPVRQLWTNVLCEINLLIQSCLTGRDKNSSKQATFEYKQSTRKNQPGQASAEKKERGEEVSLAPCVSFTVCAVPNLDRLTKEYGAQGTSQ